MYPKTAWKFKLWTDAMLRGAHVGNPEYKGKSTGSKVSKTHHKRKRRKRRKKRKDA